MMSFLVVAYRWGWRDEVRLIGLEDTLDRAVGMLAADKSGDGGKWGHQVLRYDAGEFHNAYYSPSGRGELEPEFSERAALAERLGNRILNDLANDTMLADIIAQERAIIEAYAQALKQITPIENEKH